MTASSWVRTSCTTETWTICNDCLSLLSLARTHTAPLHAADSPTAIDGKYVVVLNEYLSDDDGMPTTHNTVFVDNGLIIQEPRMSLTIYLHVQYSFGNEFQEEIVLDTDECKKQLV